jgi:hypothetical protein
MRGNDIPMWECSMVLNMGMHIPMKACEVPMWNIQRSPIWVVHSHEGTCGSHERTINVPQHGNLHSH